MHKLITLASGPVTITSYTNLHLMVGLTISFLVGLLAINLLLKIVEKVGLMPFIIYRVLLAAAILFYYHG